MTWDEIKCRLIGHRWINYRAWDVTGYPYWACRRCHAQRPERGGRR